MLLDVMTGTAAGNRNAVQLLCGKIWDHPELGLEEHLACSLQTEWLQSQGWRVTVPYAGQKTGFLAEKGTGSPVFAIASEYDALPGIGHGCGHNLICGAALTAAGILGELLKSSPDAGRIRIIGTPGEEGCGGKVRMLQHHCLDGVGAVMMVHPSSRSMVDRGSLAVRHIGIEFFGRAAHAAGDPEMGINALDAMIALFSSIALWRQQLPETSRVHGVILDGGQRPNVIPDYTRAKFYLRASENDYLEEMHRRFVRMAEGACAMTGCTFRLDESDLPYKARRPNASMNRLYRKVMGELGETVLVPEKAGRGSSDFGDFSCVCPGIHPYFAISEDSPAAHSKAFREAAGTELAYRNMEKAGIAMAYIAWHFLTDDEFRRQVISDFSQVQQ